MLGQSDNENEAINSSLDSKGTQNSERSSYFKTDICVSSSKSKGKSCKESSLGSGTVVVSVKSRPNRQNEISVTSSYKRKSRMDAGTQSSERPPTVGESRELEGEANVAPSPSAYFPTKEAASQPGSMQSERGPSPATARLLEWDSAADVGYRRVAGGALSTVEELALESRICRSEPEGTPGALQLASVTPPAAESTPKEAHIFPEVRIAHHTPPSSPEPPRKSSSPPTVRPRDRSDSESARNGTLDSGALSADARVNSFEYLPGHVYESVQSGECEWMSEVAVEPGAELEAAVDQLVRLLGGRRSPAARAVLDRLLDRLVSPNASRGSSPDPEPFRDSSGDPPARNAETAQSHKSSYNSADSSEGRLQERSNKSEESLKQDYYWGQSVKPKLKNPGEGSSKDLSRESSLEQPSSEKRRKRSQVELNLEEMIDQKGSATNNCAGTSESGRTDNCQKRGSSVKDSECSERLKNGQKTCSKMCPSNGVTQKQLADSEASHTHSGCSSAEEKYRRASLKSEHSKQREKEKSHQCSDSSLEKNGHLFVDKCVGTGMSTSLSGCESSDLKSANEASSKKPANYNRDHHSLASNGICCSKNGYLEENSDYAKSSDTQHLPPFRDTSCKQSKRRIGDSRSAPISGRLQIENIAAIKEQMDREKRNHLFWISSEINQLTCLKKMLETHEEMRSCYFRIKKWKARLAKTRAEKYNMDAGPEGDKRFSARPESSTTTSTSKINSTSDISPSESGWTSHQYDSEVDSMHQQRGGGDADCLRQRQIERENQQKHRPIDKNEHQRHKGTENSIFSKYESKESEKHNRSIQMARKGIERKNHTDLRQVRPPARMENRKDPEYKTSSMKHSGPMTAYTIQFPPKSEPKVKPKKHMTMVNIPMKYDSDDILLSVGELRTAIDDIVARHRPSISLQQQPTLKDYLENERPDMVCRAEARRQIVSEIAELRKARQEVRQRVIAGDTQNLPPPPLVKRVLSQRELRRQTERRYRQLNEVLSKKAEVKRKQEYRTNRLIAQVFNRKLQKKTLQGQVNLSNSVCVIGSS